MSNDMLRLRKVRSGFTLIELLIVIAIIAILAALSAWGVFAMIGSRQKSNSEATIRVINKLMEDRWAEVVKTAKKETPSAAVKNLAGGDAPRAQVIWIKVRLMEAFPQTFAEIANPWVYSNDPYGNGPYIPTTSQRRFIVKYQNVLANANLAKNVSATQSSACLLMALKTVGADGTLAVQDQLTHAIADTDGDLISEFVDSWSNPLVFARFGQSAAIQAANPANPNAKVKYADPVDNGGTLLSPNWYPSTLRGPPSNVNSFEARIHLVSPDNGVNAFRTIAVIQSWGKDGVLGSSDDLFSYTRGD